MVMGCKLEMTWYRIVLSYAVFSIIAKNNIVVDAAPIGRWMISKTIDDITTWVRKKSGSIEKL
jgi:hypothetical protein